MVNRWNLTTKIIATELATELTPLRIPPRSEGWADRFRRKSGHLHLRRSWCASAREAELVADPRLFQSFPLLRHLQHTPNHRHHLLLIRLLHPTFDFGHLQTTQLELLLPHQQFSHFPLRSRCHNLSLPHVSFAVEAKDFTNWFTEFADRGQPPRSLIIPDQLRRFLTRNSVGNKQSQH